MALKIMLSIMLLQHGFFIPSTVFVICVHAATAGMSFEPALAGSTLKCMFLH